MMIPQIINVGYQKRADTYTGRLAYVTYTDEKGVLRKEYSWKNWCNNDIKKDEFSNEPIEGFVLNKKVGDYKYDWNGRKAWCRIYDPRGFELEITVDNLLFILEECTSIKGKGLEGKFVYAWHGKNLILLPITADEYIKSKEFTNYKTCKVNRNEMVQGCQYLTKKMETVIYVGRYSWFNYAYNYNCSYYEIENIGKKHIFYDYDKPEEFFYMNGFTGLAKKLSDDVVNDFAIIYEKFFNSKYGTGFDKVVVKKVDNVDLNFKYYREKRKLFYSDGEKVKIIGVRKHDKDFEHVVITYIGEVGLNEKKCVSIINKRLTEQDSNRFVFRSNDDTLEMKNCILKEELLKKYDFCDVFLSNKAGQLFRIY